ncbi:MAG: hypothetical protein DRP74_02425 [Candidatus Omnitrophota bacterium]|nr:MAG: hypothetical protein DRP74_02425 [Candidatus Omnitrophota bacterium]
MFYLERGLALDLFKDRFSIIPVKDYPLLVSLTEAFFYNCLGRFDESLVKLVFMFFYLSLLAYFYSLTKDIFGRYISALFTFFLATVPLVAEFGVGYYLGYADLVFTYFNFVSVTSLWLWILQKKKEFFYISSLFVGFALWTKLEGLVLFAANLICLVTAKFFFQKDKRAFLKIILNYAFFPVLVAISWYYTVFSSRASSVHFSAQSLPFSFGLIINRFLKLSNRFFQESLTFSRWNIFWVLLIMLPLIYFKRITNKNNAPVLLNLILQLFLYTVVIIIDIDFNTVLFNSLSRLMMHLIPLVILVILNNVFENKTAILARENKSKK